LPSTIGQLNKVVEMNLDENKITSLPRQFGNMKALEVLNINHNELVDLPNELYVLPLRIFGIDDNPFDNIPLHVVETGSQGVFDWIGQRYQNPSLNTNG